MNVPHDREVRMHEQKPFSGFIKAREGHEKGESEQREAGRLKENAKKKDRESVERVKKTERIEREKEHREKDERKPEKRREVEDRTQEEQTEKTTEFARKTPQQKKRRRNPESKKEKENQRKNTGEELQLQSRSYCTWTILIHLLLFIVCESTREPDHA